MLTKNWYAQLRSAMRKTVETGTLTQITGEATDSSWSSNLPDRFMIGTSTSGNIRLNDTSAGFIVGTGSTPATVNDYKLESKITSGISGSWTAVNGVYRITITNNSEDSVTIQEVGYMANCYYKGSNYACMCLIDRTVLTSPITIQPGESGVIDYSFDLQIPEA